MLKHFYYLFSFIVLLSCSSAILKHDEKVSTQESQEKVFESVSAKLKSLVEETLKQGDDQINYLASDMYLKASAAQIQGDFQTANLIYAHLNTLVPKNDFLQRKYSVSLIREGRLDESQKLLETITKRTKYHDTDSSLLLAGIYSTLGKTKKAQVIYGHVLKINPKDEDACVFLSKSYAVEKKYTKAVKQLQSCEKRDPQNGLFSYYIGKVYLDKGDEKQGTKYLQRALKISPSLYHASLALGDIYEKKGKNQKAQKVFESFLKNEPNHQEILSRLVNNLFSREKYKDVLSYAQRLSDLDQSDLNLKVKLGILYTDNKDYKEAISIFSEVLKEVPGNDKMLYYIGAIYQETKQIDFAVSFYSQIDVESALYADSSLQVASMLSSQAQSEYSSLEQKKEKYTQFSNFIKETLTKSPSIATELSVIAANLHEGIGEAKKSIDLMESIRDEKKFTNDHRYYLASLYEKEKDYDKSYRVIEEILKSDPNDAYAYNFLGYSLVQRGVDMDKAHEYLSKAVSLKPKDGFIKDSLGWYYYRVGQEEKALELLKVAAAIEPKDISIQKHLAIVYSKLRAFSEARSYIKSALALAKTQTDKKELQEAFEELSLERIPASFE